MRRAEPAKIEQGNIAEFMETSPRLTNTLLKEIVEQLKLANTTLEEIHDEVHEISNNRGGGF